MLRLATDIGGTFTDLVGFDEETGAVIDRQGIDDAGRPAARACWTRSPPRRLARGRRRAVHGTTVVINALTERRGRKYGAGDDAWLPRRARDRPRKPAGHVQPRARASRRRSFPRRHRFEVRERVDRRGERAPAARLDDLERGRRRRAGVTASRRSPSASCTPTPHPAHEQAVRERSRAALPGRRRDDLVARSPGNGASTSAPAPPC